MTAPAHSFDDGEAYERFMGSWSRSVAKPFLQWLAVPAEAAWLDVGCGTGVFTATVLDRAAPSSLVAIDPSSAQVAFARKRIEDERVAFEVGDAQALPFMDASFDIVCSALVLNFVSDRAVALSEMRRVARPSALIAAYVWDFESELSPSGPLRAAMRKIGLAAPAMPGSAASTMTALRRLFISAGLQDVRTRRLKATGTFRDFTDYWEAQTPSYSPTTKVINQLSSDHRAALIRVVQEMLPSKDGKLTFSACANAVKARVPV